jgi:release factor glutamine methyltransferase
MTVAELFKLSTSIYAEKNIQEPEYSSRFLLCDAGHFGYKLSDFRRHLNEKLPQKDFETFLSHHSKRLDRTPVQYIIGNWDFFGLTFECIPPILIPRPETEELVERILNSKVLQAIASPRILDVGSGTGAIGISLLSRLPESASCHAIDINEKAVSLSIKNYLSLLGGAGGAGGGGRGRYTCSHSDFLSYSSSSGELFDLVVSNPPYIPSLEVEALGEEVRGHEDRGALDGGPDGLSIVRQLVRRAHLLLSPSGTRELWIEVSPEHPDMLREWIRGSPNNIGSGHFELEDFDGSPHRGGVKVQMLESIVDLMGNQRFVRFHFSSKNLLE